MANVTKIEKSEFQERNPIIERAYKALCKRQRNGQKPRVIQDALIQLATDLETKNLDLTARLKKEGDENYKNQVALAEAKNTIAANDEALLKIKTDLAEATKLVETLREARSKQDVRLANMEQQLEAGEILKDETSDALPTAA